MNEACFFQLIFTKSEEQKRKFAERNKNLEEQINDLITKKDEIFNAKNPKNSMKPKKLEKKNEEPKDKELEEMEKEFRILQVENQKINNKISLIKMSLNMDNLTRFCE